MVIHAKVKLTYINACVQIVQHDKLDEADIKFLANAISNASEVLTHLLQHQQAGPDAEDLELEFTRPDGSPLITPPEPDPVVEHTFYDIDGVQITLEELQAGIRSRILNGPVAQELPQ